jgi:dTDP-glucose 4,6-dehydratase
VVQTICALLDRMEPSPDGPRRRLIEFVADRPGHDRRYAIDAGKIEAALGWRPAESFDTGLEKTVRWFLDNRPWWQDVMARGYHATRIGVLDTAATTGVTAGPA